MALPPATANIYLANFADTHTLFPVAYPPIILDFFYGTPTEVRFYEKAQAAFWHQPDTDRIPLACCSRGQTR
jgi:hypothetical protein